MGSLSALESKKVNYVVLTVVMVVIERYCTSL